MIIRSYFQEELDPSLRDFELVLKELNEKYPNRTLSKPHDLEEIKDMIHQAVLKHPDPFAELLINQKLEEALFFHHNTDVEIYQHLRYLPANWHSHAFIEIAYVVQGSCNNYILEQKLSMRTGDICIIAPGTQHAVSAFSDDCLLFNFILRTSTFETTFFDILNENDILSDFFMKTLYDSKKNPYLLFRTGDDRELLSYLGYAYREFHRNRQYKNRMITSIIHSFFITLLRNHGANVIFPESESDLRDENTILILKYIQEHYHTVTLAELSGFFNYSERQLQRIIKGSTGRSFSENIQKLKLRQAARLLQNPSRSVSSVADELGYADPGSFRNMFKKYYGMTPGEYRIKSET